MNHSAILGTALGHLGQAFLLGLAYMLFALWSLIEILKRDLGGNTPAAEFMLFIKTRQVPGLQRDFRYGSMFLGKLGDYCV